MFDPQTLIPLAIGVSVEIDENETTEAISLITQDTFPVSSSRHSRQELHVSGERNDASSSRRKKRKRKEVNEEEDPEESAKSSSKKKRTMIKTQGGILHEECRGSDTLVSYIVVETRFNCFDDGKITNSLKQIT